MDIEYLKELIILLFFITMANVLLVVAGSLIMVL
jgi:hypothetical protein